MIDRLDECKNKKKPAKAIRSSERITKGPHVNQQKKHMYKTKINRENTMEPVDGRR